jgi:ferric-dicitrate binding protein FerR (iron transport regulator)
VRHNELVRRACCDKLTLRRTPSLARSVRLLSEPIRGHMACRTIHRSHPSRRLLSTCLLLSLLIACRAVVRAQDPALRKLEAQYQSETNAVRKAKLLAKLGPMEVDEAARQINEDRDEMALSALARFRDEARETADALAATQVNAARHPAGFKELQIGLRESLRRLGDLLLLVPSEEQPRFEVLRSDLSATQNSLIEALFPSSKEKREKDGKAD